tara:strand:- start:236 stop:349 length:114 start_codon:yes stop_codon:yes gene_type:complete
VRRIASATEPIIIGVVVMVALELEAEVEEEEEWPRSR